MKVLLSIKPEFALKIFNGEKRYEYRKSIFKNSKVNEIIVYASSPIKRIVGEFRIDSIICDRIDSLWKRTKKHGGISRDYYYEYFSEKNKGYAIKIKDCRIYDKPIKISELFNTRPPQSFAYVE